MDGNTEKHERNMNLTTDDVYYIISPLYANIINASLVVERGNFLLKI